MRKIKEVLRLSWEAKLSHRKVASCCNIAHSTVREILKRAEDAGLSWPLPAEMNESELEAKLYGRLGPAKQAKKPEPDMAYLHRELRRKGVTLQLLWEEYKQDYPDGYQYSQFCERYRRWRKTLRISLRQVHRAGEKMFVDYSGPTVPIVDPKTGTVRMAKIFVAVLGASSYTFADAVWSESLPDWLMANCRAFEFFGGVPEIVVSDNLKSAVSRACRYEPGLNRSFEDLAAHYGTVIIPTRPRHPRDNAKAEVAVQVVQRWIVARLRKRTFFSLGELSDAIAELLEQLNQRPFQKMPGSRATLFEALDKPALSPLPPTRYEYARWITARVNIDYHITVEKNFYSVPYQLVRQEVDVRLTARIVEVLHKGQRVASHTRNYGKGIWSTKKEHMPASHRRHLEWTPSRIIRWGCQVGPSTGQLAKAILETKQHPEQGFRSCLGLYRLGQRYTTERLEAACARALATGAVSYRSVKSILETGLDHIPLESAPEQAPIQHDNLRGPDYYAHLGGQSHA